MGKPLRSNSVGIINQKTKAGWFPAVLGQQYLLNVIWSASGRGHVLYLRYSKQGFESRGGRVGKYSPLFRY